MEGGEPRVRAEPTADILGPSARRRFESVFLRITRVFLLLLTFSALVAVAGCGPEEPDPETDSESEAVLAEESVEEPAQVEDVLTRRRRRRLERERAITFVSSFPHDPHTRIACERCHSATEAHATHRDDVGCADCHSSPGTDAMTTPSEAECLDCHHGADHQLTCQQCHSAAERPDGLVQVRVEMTVYPSPLERSLRFEHGLHEALACTSCHVEPTTYRAPNSCAGCHAEHHQADSDCLTCHTQESVAGHGLDVHTGCSGGGCHSDPDILALPLSRNVCLSCHEEQIDHEAPQECVDCHAPQPLSEVTEVRR
jgi:hypothetical protein